MITKDGRVIADLEDWRVRAGPKRAEQWKDGRSAKEAARAWLGAAPAIPKAVGEVLTQHQDFGEFQRWEAEPEKQVRFDKFRGEPPNIDVLLIGHDTDGPVVAAIEAKADEPFGYTVARTLAAAERRLAKNPRSKGVARLQQLTAAILGVKPETVTDVRYQLLTATAAVVAEADRWSAERAVLIVHEFVTDETTDARHLANASDLDAFVSLLSRGVVGSVPAGALVGPFTLPGGAAARPIRLYVGKATEDLRGRTG